MQKFLNYKSKIVKSKRDSQKIEEDNLFHLVREYQQLKTIKKQMKNKGQLETLLFHTIQSPIYEQPLVERSQTNTSNILCDSQSYQNDHISMDKYQSTMSSLISSQSNESIQQTYLTKISNITCSCQQHLHPNQILTTKSHTKANNETKSILCLQERVNARRQLLSVKQNLEIFSNNDKEIFQFYEQSQCKQNYYQTKHSNSLQGFNTSRQPLQLSQFHLSKSKIKQRSFLFEHEHNEDQDKKVEMLFREQYKDIFSSSMSNIQFNEFASSNNSLKNELEPSNSFFNDLPPEVSKFQTILDIINQKDSKNESKPEKHIVKDQIPQRKRQKVIILNPKQQANSKHADIAKNSKAVKAMHMEKTTVARK